MLFAYPRFICRAKSFIWRFSCLLIVGLLGACQHVAPSATGVQAQYSAAISSVISTRDAQKIDHLLDLIDQRLSVASQVAKAKWNSGAAVDDPKRELQILDDVTMQANALGGLDPLLVRDFFQNQFDAGKILQKNLLDGWRQTVMPGYKFDDAPDLGREVRPILDRLTPQLIAALHDVQPLLKQPDVHRYIAIRAATLIRGDVNGRVRGQALMSLQAE